MGIWLATAKNRLPSISGKSITNPVYIGKLQNRLSPIAIKKRTTTIRPASSSSPEWRLQLRLTPKEKTNGPPLGRIVDRLRSVGWSKRRAIADGTRCGLNKPLRHLYEGTRVDGLPPATPPHFRHAEPRPSPSCRRLWGGVAALNRQTSVTASTRVPHSSRSRPSGTPLPAYRPAILLLLSPLLLSGHVAGYSACRKCPRASHATNGPPGGS